MKQLYFYLFLALVGILAFFSSCSTPKDIAYFQDFNTGKSIVVQNPVEIKFKADDEITISVSTQDAELDMRYSLGQGVSKYTIDSEGCIRFPKLGKIHVAGLNRQEL